MNNFSALSNKLSFVLSVYFVTAIHDHFAPSPSRHASILMFFSRSAGGNNYINNFLFFFDIADKVG